MKRKFAVVMILLFVMTMFIACDNSSTGKTPEGGSAADEGELDTSSPVNLVVYMLGDGAKDDQKVFDELNKKTGELINTTFERKLISWADFNTMYPLVFASGEEFDLIFTSNWSFYAQQAVKDGFLELTDELLERCAPNIAANIPPTAWKQARINGKIYMVPNTQSEYNHLGILIRGDLRKKYDVPEITSLEVLEQYLDAVAENETGILPLDGGAEFDKWTNETLWFAQPNNLSGTSVPGYYFKLSEDDGTMYYGQDMPEFKEYRDRMVEYNNRGYWSKNALNQQNRLDDNFKNGTSAMAMHNVGTMVGAWRETNKNHPEWEAEVYDSMFGEYLTVRTSYLGNGMAVHAASANPERSLLWLDTIRFNQESYDLMMGGIEGDHWIDAGEGLSTPGANSADYGGFSNWGFTTEEMKRTSTEEWPGMQTLLEEYAQRAVDCPPVYFLFDDSECKNEVAAMTNIGLKYDKMYNFGFDSDWETTQIDVNNQYEDAGRSKVKELFEAQLKDFVTAYKAG